MKDSNKINSDKNANLASEDKPEFVTFQAFNVSACVKLKWDEWIIDGGCTSHMVPDRKHFIDYKPIKGKVYLAGKRNVLESEGIGSIRVKV